MNPQRDLQNIRFVGALSLGIGAVLLVITILTTLLTLYSLTTTTNTNFIRGIIIFIFALLTSAIMMGCGAELQTHTAFGPSDIENLRLTWTALVLTMIVVCILSPWLIPPLVYVGILMLLLLFAVRGSVIRLTR